MSVECELELVNLVEVSQDKLVKNFTILLSRLAKHEEMLVQHKQAMTSSIENNKLCVEEMIMEIKNDIVGIRQGNVDLERRVLGVETGQAFYESKVNEETDMIKRLNAELFTTQVQFEQKSRLTSLELSQIVQTNQRMQTQMVTLADQLGKKQNIIDAEKGIKEIEILKSKQVYLQGEIKASLHKIEKIELLGQKAERERAKKDLQLLKQFDDKIRREFVTTRTETQTGVSRESRRQSGYETLEQLRNSHQEPHGIGLSSDMFKSNIEGSVQKCEAKMRGMEVQVKELQDNWKAWAKNANVLKKSQASKQNTEGIKQKINELKPQIIKLWAKMDTLQDRLSFNERKLQEKLRVVNDLATIVKQNNTEKLEQKLKVLQTELLTSLKEIRGKMETKVKQIDYDKYCETMQQRMIQTHQLIGLKSDKMQVKKALLFLESKIKEIILVISQDEENEKDALLTKKQLKCMSCDKELDKFNGVVSSPKGNWDAMPYKDHPPEILGRFGMTNFGSLAKKIKRLEGKDLPLLNRKNNTLNNSQTGTL